jgi:hypothetical protein
MWKITLQCSKSLKLVQIPPYSLTWYSLCMPLMSLLHANCCLQPLTGREQKGGVIVLDLTYCDVLHWAVTWLLYRMHLIGAFSLIKHMFMTPLSLPTWICQLILISPFCIMSLLFSSLHSLPDQRNVRFLYDLDCFYFMTAFVVWCWQYLRRQAAVALSV